MKNADDFRKEITLIAAQFPTARDPVAPLLMVIALAMADIIERMDERKPNE